MKARARRGGGGREGAAGKETYLVCKHSGFRASRRNAVRKTCDNRIALQDCDLPPRSYTELAPCRACFAYRGPDVSFIHTSWRLHHLPPHQMASSPQNHRDIPCLFFPLAAKLVGMYGSWEFLYSARSSLGSYFWHPGMTQCACSQNIPVSFLPAQVLLQWMEAGNHPILHLQGSLKNQTKSRIQLVVVVSHVCMVEDKWQVSCSLRGRLHAERGLCHCMTASCNLSVELGSPHKSDGAM